MDVLVPTRQARSWRDEVAANYEDLQTRLTDLLDDEDGPEEFI